MYPANIAIIVQDKTHAEKEFLESQNFRIFVADMRQPREITRKF